MKFRPTAATTVMATSLAAHLTGVGWILEYRGDAASGSDQLRRWLNSRPGLVKPPLPESYGDLTIEAIEQALAYRGHAR